jgi:hypothetical protein
MGIDAMARRCPRSKALGLARLERHRLAVMREGWLTVIRDTRSAVHGVLWDLALSDVAALDRHEALPQGLYTKETQPIIAERGPKRAIVYFGTNAGPGFRVRLTLLRCWPRRNPGRFRRRASRRWSESRNARRCAVDLPGSRRSSRTSLRAPIISKAYLRFCATFFGFEIGLQSLAPSLVSRVKGLFRQRADGFFESVLSGFKGLSRHFRVAPCL